MSTKTAPAPEATPAVHVAETTDPGEKLAPDAAKPEVKRQALADNARARALAAMKGKPPSKRPTAPAKTEPMTTAKPAPTEAAADDDDEDGDEIDGAIERTERIVGAKPTEKPTETKTTPATEPDDLRRARIGIAREEQRIRSEREKLKAETDRLAEASAKASAKLAAIEKINSGDVLTGLRELGLSYEQLTAAAMKRPGGASPTDMKKLVDDAIGAATKPLQEQLEAERKARESAEARALQTQWQAATRAALAAEPERWELLTIEYDDPTSAIRDEMVRDWEEGGKLLDSRGHAVCLTEAEAADRIEARLLKAHERRMKAKKLAARTEPEEDPKLPDDAQTEPLQAGEKGGTNGGTRKRPPKTLTNTDASTVARSGPSNDPKVYRARALAVMRNSRAATS
jgi:hypothetical protein